MAKKRNKSPKKADVCRFWGDAFGTHENECMACGSEGDDTPYSIQRAHIHSHRASGNAYAGNLHLLCVRCHKQSEFFEGDNYWRWMSCTRISKGLDWNKEIIEVLANMYNPEHVDHRLVEVA